MHRASLVRVFVTTHAGVLEGLSTLRQGGVRPRWVILDDGWQSTTNDDALNTEQWDERLVALEANKRFRCGAQA